MTSMTEYWQQFKDCIDILPTASDEKCYSTQMSVARQLIETGLSIETIGITAIQKVSDSLFETAKGFNYSVAVSTDEKKYQFYLPEIVGQHSLMFAMIYYQHLCNYSEVSYQGSIYWFKQKVIDGVNHRKHSTRLQAQAMLAEISRYCQTHNIPLETEKLVRTNSESAEEYLSRLQSLLIINSVPENKAPPAEQAVNISELERLNNETRQKIVQLKDSKDTFLKKLAHLHHTAHDYNELNRQWQQYGIFRKIYYWLCSHFYQQSFYQNLVNARQQLCTAEDIVNQMLPPSKNIETHHLQLIAQIDALHSELESTQQKILIEQSKQSAINSMPEEVIEVSPPKAAEAIPHIESKKEPSPQVDNPVVVKDEGASEPDYNFGFFKAYMPKKALLQALSIGVAAIAIQIPMQ